MDKVLVVNNMDFSYDDNIVFEDTCFYLERNTLNYVIGSNNSGKTTLIKLLSGVLPSFNCIKIDNVLLNHKNLNRYVRIMGVVLTENNNQFLFDTVIKELTFPLENLYLSKKKIYKRVDEVLCLLNMQALKNKKISDLSNIEKTKLLIGLSIIHKPKVIFLDNPYLYLNKKESNVINKLLKSIVKSEKITVLVTTMNLENIIQADNVIVLGKKGIILQGTPLEVLKQDNILARNDIYIPTMINLSVKLGEYDLLNKIILDPKRMVDTLWK